MSQDKPSPQNPDKNLAAVQRMGKEDVFTVFRPQGGNEFSGQHDQRKTQTDSDSVAGPVVSDVMNDARIRRHDEIIDAEGPARLRQMLDADGPSDSRAMLDAEGPSESRAMIDAEGPSRLRQMLDAIGPIVPRRLEDSHGWLTRQPLAQVHLRQAGATEDTDNKVSASAAPPTSMDSGHNVHVQTFAIDMRARLARVQASQKETLEKMKQLEEDSHEPDDPPAKPHSRTHSIPLAINTLMHRHILNASLIHPAIRSLIGSYHKDVVEEVQQAIAANRVVVVGMAGNPVVSKAKKLFSAKGVAFAYLEYGGYFSQWRRRNALKMWTGWPTFPMIFLDGVLLGGYQDLKALEMSGELQQRLGGAASSA